VVSFDKLWMVVRKKKQEERIKKCLSTALEMTGRSEWYLSTALEMTW
jgi:hypothetical protein